MGPASVGDDLRFAVLADPQRAAFGLMSWNAEPPTGVFAWDELYAADVDEAATFYGDLVAGEHRSRSSAGVGERADEGAVAGEVPRKRVVGDRKPVRVVLPPGYVVAGDDAAHALVGLERT